MNTVSFIANRSNEFSWFCTLGYSSRQSSKAKFLLLDFRGRKTRKWVQNGAFWSLWWMNAWCGSFFFAWSCTSIKAWNCFKQFFFFTVTIIISGELKLFFSRFKLVDFFNEIFDFWKCFGMTCTSINLLL